MHAHHRVTALCIALGLALVLCAGCSSTASVASQPVTSPVTVDGSEADWQTALQRVKGLDGAFLGVRNDGEDLYVALVVSDEALARQIAMGGLTLWLDPEGGKEKTLGVQFPLGRRGMGGPPEGFDPRSAGGARPDSAGARRGPGAMPAPSFDQLAIRRGEDDAGTPQPADGSAGVTAAGALNAGQLVYEVRIPLRGNGLVIREGDEIGLGLETAEVERPERGQGGPPSGRMGGPPSGGMGGPPSGGMGGPPSGGRSGPPPGGPGGRGPAGEQADPLDTWVRVTLTEG